MGKLLMVYLDIVSWETMIFWFWTEKIEEGLEEVFENICLIISGKLYIYY